MRAAIVVVAFVVTLGLLTSDVAVAQSAATPHLTLGAGHADFLDEGRIGHTSLGAGAEWLLLPRLAIGPEVLYLVGPGEDRDTLVLGVARIGLRPFAARVVPFFTIGAGLITHRDRYGSQSYHSTEGAWIGGGGVRINASSRIFIAPEFTVGWEPHIRASVSVGFRLR
jgi:hypothetical protein